MEDKQNLQNNQQIRRAWILADVNECNGTYYPKEMLVDYNDDYNIYFVNREGKPVSPTKALKAAMNTIIRKHISGTNQHLEATSEQSGFMSASDKVLIEKLKELRDYIIENPYVEISSINSISKGFLTPVRYHISGDKFILEDMIYSYKGYTYDIKGCSLPIGERKEEYYEQIVHLQLNITDDNLGKNKYDIQLCLVKDDGSHNEDNIIPLFKLRRCNNKKFNPSNPLGYLYDNCILDDTEIIPLWYMIMDHNDAILECKKAINTKHKPMIQEVCNYHFGMPRLPITEDTLALVDVLDSNAIDFVTHTNLAKGSTFKLSPTGFAISTSKEKGVNLPISLDKVYTIEFLLSANTYDELINEDILAFNDKEYNTILSFKVISQDLNNTKLQNLYLHVNGVDKLLVENIDDDYNMYKIIYQNETLEVRCNEKTLTTICNVSTDLSKVAFFEVSSLNVPICNVRLSKVSLAEENILPMDIQYNKAKLLPPIVEGNRKLSNGTCYVYNNVKLKYSDVGLMKDKEGISWHKGDIIPIYKNENEVISGVYNKAMANAIVTGIKSENTVFVNDISKLNIYDTVKIAKYTKNLFKIFKILDINEEDNSVRILDVTNSELTSVNLDESYIYSNIYVDDINPSIELVRRDGSPVNISQFPDDFGNVKIQILEDISDEELYLSYTMISNYNELIPAFTKIEKVYMDNVECVPLEDTVVKVVNDIVDIKDSGKSIDSNIINKYVTDKSDISFTISIPLVKVLSDIEVVEESIIKNILDTVSISFDMANSEDVTISTVEESISIKKSNILTRYDLVLVNTEKTVIDDNYIINIKMSGDGEKAVLMNNLNISLSLKQCGSTEVLYHKNNSNKIEDMVIINTNPNNLYVKTIINTDNDTNILLTVLKESDNSDFDNEDIIIDTIKNGKKEYNVRVDESKMLYLSKDSKKISLPKQIMLRGDI